MNKQSLSLVALAAAALFSIGVNAQTAPLQSDRSFDFNSFYMNKSPAADSMVSKQQYMKEMERRWTMAEKMNDAKAKKGWVSRSNLMKAMEQPNVSNGGGAQ